MSKKQDVVLVVGVFDLFHRGHVELLKKAAAYGSRLVVIINGDDFTGRYKRRPYFTEVDRRHIVASLKWVDDTAISNSPDIKPFIEKWNVGVIVHGDDWSHESYLQQICINEDYIAERKIKMVYTPYYQGISTSRLIETIRAGHAEPDAVKVSPPAVSSM